MAVSQSQLALQMLAQLRVLDPSVSGEIGTPERKILDTVAEAIADVQVDLSVLQGALDVDSKFGDNLDRFLALFGFARQQSTKAFGFVEFSRLSTATVDIRIPFNTQVMAPGASSDGNDVIFATTFESTLPAGELSIIVPVQASNSGDLGNVAANTITTFIGQPVFGVSSVTNLTPTSGGNNAESDDEYKIRFRNTIFRNLSGTQDQFIALAASTAFTTKATVVGPVSRYREYLQVPPVDDTLSYDVNEDGIGETGDPFPGGSNASVAGEYSTALSTIPFSKYTYTEIPYFVSNGESGVSAVFYRPSIDYRLNTTALAKNHGDAYRFAHTSVAPTIDVDPTSVAATFRPNVTFTNVLSAAQASIFDGIGAQQTVLFEHSYLSSASRNDPIRNIHNCIDVFIDGENPTLATANLPSPGPSPFAIFNTTTTSPYYYNSYRRIGDPDRPPLTGNVFFPLFNQPTISLPDSITVAGTLAIDQSNAFSTFYLGVHYWLVEDITLNRGTVRSRNGIEFSLFAGQAAADPPAGPYTGPTIIAFDVLNVLPIVDYSYDKNVLDLQANLEANKQVTTDVLAHSAKMRYFKLDITVMYTQGITNAVSNQGVFDAISNFFAGQYFGSTIQLSDLLSVIHNVDGIDNVRWSSDIPGNADLERVTETTSVGEPILDVLVDVIQTGTVSTPNKQRIIVAGDATGGSWTLTLNTDTSNIIWPTSAGTLQTTINSFPSFGNVTVTGSGMPEDPFLITFTANGAQPTFVGSIPAVIGLSGSPTKIKADFFLQDNELPALPTTTVPGDNLPGLIIRARAQNTWTRG